MKVIASPSSFLLLQTFYRLRYIASYRVAGLGSGDTTVQNSAIDRPHRIPTIHLYVGTLHNNVNPISEPGCGIFQISNLPRHF
jgi:hypothetical protein